jgi:UDP-glucose 6-dehydrogenase
LEQGVNVRAFDPAVQQLPDDLKARITLCKCAMEALLGCDAAVFATDWPQFGELAAEDLISRMKTAVVVDANRFLERTLAGNPALVYVAVGVPKETG